MPLFIGSTQGTGGDQQKTVGVGKLLAYLDDMYVFTKPDRVHCSSPESVDPCVREHQQWQDQGVERCRAQAGTLRSPGQGRTSVAAQLQKISEKHERFAQHTCPMFKRLGSCWSTTC